MSHPVTGIDHVFLLVNDLADSANRFARLGFTVSPRGLHSPAMGSANHTIMFPDDYFELLGMIAETDLNADKRKVLHDSGAGLRAIACRIGDAYDAHNALGALGIDTTPVKEFSRPLPLPDGGQGVAAFAVTEFAPHEAPAGTVFMCQHKTRDMVWRPELIQHANGASGLAGIVAITDDPAVTAAAFARLFAAGVVDDDNQGCVTVTTGGASAPIRCMTRNVAALRYSDAAIAATPQDAFAVLQISVADIGVVENLLSANGVATHRNDTGGLWVAPTDASGTIIEFVPA